MTRQSLLVWCGALTVLMHFAAVFYSHGFYHVDEHFQILEFLMTKLPPRASGQTTVLPWEFTAQIRPWLQIAWYALFAYPMSLLGFGEGWRLAAVFRLINALMGLGSIACMIAAMKKLYKDDEWKQKACIIMMTLLFYVPYLHTRTSSENYGGLLSCFAISLYLLKLDDATVASFSRRLFGAAFAVGVLWGLAFHVRFQMALALLGFGLWLLLIRRLPWTLVCWMAGGFVCTEILSSLVDVWGYGTWVWTPWMYFKANIIEGRAKLFGVQPWWAWWQIYAVDMLEPYGGFVLLGSLTAILLNRKNIYAWTCGVFILGHIFQPHKEDRFFFPLSDLIIPLYPSLFLWLRPLAQRVKWKLVAQKAALIGLLGVNVAGLIYMTASSWPGNIQQLEILERDWVQNPKQYQVYWRILDPFMVENSIPLYFYAAKDKFSVTKVAKISDLPPRSEAGAYYFFNVELGCPQADDPALGNNSCTLLKRTPTMVTWWHRYPLYCSWFWPRARYELYSCLGANAGKASH